MASGKKGAEPRAAPRVVPGKKKPKSKGGSSKKPPTGTWTPGLTDKQLKKRQIKAQQARKRRAEKKKK